MWLIFVNLVNELDFADMILSHWMIWYGNFGLQVPILVKKIWSKKIGAKQSLGALKQS